MVVSGDSPLTILQNIHLSIVMPFLILSRKQSDPKNYSTIETKIISCHFDVFAID